MCNYGVILSRTVPFPIEVYHGQALSVSLTLQQSGSVVSRVWWLGSKVKELCGWFLLRPGPQHQLSLSFPICEISLKKAWLKESHGRQLRLGVERSP